jgi:hypothetical protein
MQPPVSLAEALETQDPVAVALAIRNGTVTVPLLPFDGDPQVRVFRRGDADKYMLLLFSSPETYAAMVPEEDDLRTVEYDAAALKDFLAQNSGVLEAVWFDVAGPNAMQATPQDVLDALQLGS